MEEKMLLRMRHLRDKRRDGTITKEEAEELNKIESGLNNNVVFRDLSEEYTIEEIAMKFD